MTAHRLTLQRHLESGPLSPEEAVRLGLSLVEALVERARPGAPGLAPHLVQLTILAGEQKATLGAYDPEQRPEFEAPERSGGLEAATTAATDLYEVGLLLYWALSGRPAFEQLSPAVVWDRQLSSPLDPLPAGLARPLRALVRRLLQPDPRDRYHSYRGLRHDLLRLQQGEVDFCLGAQDLRTALAPPDYSGEQNKTEELLTAARERGMVNLVGASGSGKSRLLAELGESARSSGWLVLQLQGEPLSETLAQSIAPLLDHGESLESCRPAARAMAHLLEELASLDSTSDASLQLSESLVEAKLEGLLESLGRAHSRPVLLLVDDAQWLAASLLRALSHASSNGNLATVTAARVLSTEAADQTLGALLEKNLRELLTSMSGPLPEPVLASLLTASGGSPFLAVEGLRGWVEGGRLRVTARGWEEADAPARASGRAGALLAQRLDLLTPAQERVLAAAAVLGRAVDPGAVAELLEEAETVREAVSSALEQRLLWRTEGGALTFCHDRIREELEARLAPNQLRGLHAAAGYRARERAPRDPFPQAYHFHKAGLHQLSVEPALEAGRAARRAGDLALAERCYRMVLLDQPGTAARRELAEVLVSRGSNFDEARVLLAQALTEAGTPRERAAVDASLANLEYRCDQPRAALEHLRRALQVLGRPWPGRASVGLRIGGELLTYFFHLAVPGRLQSKKVEDPLEFSLTVELLKRTAEVGFEIGDASIVAWAHLHALNSVELFRPTPQLGNLYSYHLAVLAGQLRQPKLPGKHWRAGLRALRRHGTPHQRGKAGVWMAMRHFLLGRLNRASRTAEQSLAELEEAGDLWEAQIVIGLLSNIRFAQGRLGEALDLARRAYHGAVRWNNALAAARALLAWAQASDGGFPRELLETELRRAGTSAYRLFELHQAEALFLAGEERYLEACRAMEKALTSGRPLASFASQALPWQVTWLRLAFEKAGEDEREQLLKWAWRTSRRALRLSRGRPQGLAHALREAGLLAARRQDPRAARFYLDRSVEMASQYGQARERALSLQERGRLGLVLGWEGAQRDLELSAEWTGQSRRPEPPALKARLAVLLEAARNLLDGSGQEQFLSRAADALRFMTRAEKAWVLSGPPESVRASQGGAVPASPEPYAHCLKLGQSYRLEDPESDLALARHGVRSALYVPLGPVSAVLLVHSKIGNLFGPEDTVLADFLARLTKAVLESQQRLTELRDSELRFRTLFENAGVGLQLISLQGVLLAENQFLRDRLGLGSPDPADPLSLLEAPDRQRELDVLTELMAGERESYSLMLRHRRHSGASAWTQVTSTLLRTADGRPARVVRAVSDISTRQLERVIDFGEAQRQLLAMDLHDGIAQQLIAASFQSYVGSPEQALEVVRKELSASVEEVRRLYRDLSSPLATRKSYRKALRDFLINLEITAGLRLDWRIRRRAGTLWPRGLSGLFGYRIVQEALSNVLRHSRADWARVRLYLEPDRLRGEVLDNGVGIDPGRTGSSPDGRARLGLAGIRLRCELLGGRCRIDNMPDGGTRVRFVLPREGET